MRRILLTGRRGQVGWELERALASLGEVTALDRDGMDLTDPDSIRAAIRACRPTLIVNAAAYTAVDKAEAEPQVAMAVNGVAPGIMAEEARRLGGALVHLSTDYVFDGRKPAPYVESDLPSPLSAYGSSKLAGERAIQQQDVPHLILRTSWVYGARGSNFLRTIARLAKERDELRIVDDQIGAPTWCRELANAVARIVSLAAPPPADGGPPLRPGSDGIYHLTAGGETSWYGFADAALRGLGLRTRLERIRSDQYAAAAKRPANSRLSNAKVHDAFGVVLADWREALASCLAELASIADRPAVA